MEEKTTKVIKNPTVAKKLCNMGNPIISIKKNKFKNDGSSVFVFAITEKFNEDLATIVGPKAETE